MMADTYIGIIEVGESVYSIIHRTGIGQPCLYAGTTCNTGFIQHYAHRIDPAFSLDENISAFIERICALRRRKAMVSKVSKLCPTHKQSMCVLSVKEIAKACEHLTGRANISAINKLYRLQDESHKYPICGRFNVTERAIRKARKFRRLYWGDVSGYEYAMALDMLISDIVNAEV